MLHMMFKLGQCAQENWRRLRGFAYVDMRLDKSWVHYPAGGIQGLPGGIDTEQLLTLANRLDTPSFDSHRPVRDDAAGTHRR